MISLRIARKEVMALDSLWVIGFFAWLWGFCQSLPVYDEVFSAINIPGEGADLSLRYYYIAEQSRAF